MRSINGKRQFLFVSSTYSVEINHECRWTI